MKKHKMFLALIMALISVSFMSFTNNASAATYEASITTSGTVNLDVTASGNGANVTTDNVNIVSTCPTGYNVAVAASTADTTLYKDGNSSNTAATKKITASTGTIDTPVPIIGSSGSTSYQNTWGFTTEGLNNNNPVTVNSNFVGLTNTQTLLAASTTGTESTGTTLPVYYGVSVDSSTEPGTYKMANNAVITYYLIPDINCTGPKVKYHGNNNDTGTTMSIEYNDVEVGTILDLAASNFKRAGYGFAGWSTVQIDPNATDAKTRLQAAVNAGRVFGPNETITLNQDFISQKDNTNTIYLYAVWIKSEGNLQSWQGCPAMSTGDVTALKDDRDNNVYTVAKLADGNCWMIENLRLADQTSTGTTIELSTTNTNNPSLPLNNTWWTSASNYGTLTTSNHLSATSSSWCTASNNNANCVDQSMLNTNNTANPTTNMTAYNNNTNTYSLGNYYNWYSATAGNGTYNFGINNNSVAGDICPAGWHLPKGGSSGSSSSASATNSDFWKLGLGIMGFVPSNNSYYQSPETNAQGKTGTQAFRSYPNNFIYSGFWSSDSANGRSTSGNYWSSTTYGKINAYGLSLSGSNVYPGTGRGSKYHGISARCLIGGELPTEPGKITYDDNGANSPTTMGDQSVASSDTEVTLWASNFQRPGYGFAGWSTKPITNDDLSNGEALINLPSDVTAYGPNETINDPTIIDNIKTNGLRLYAIWIPAMSDMSMQDLNSSACSGIPNNAIIAMTDARDNQTYAITKLADGNCWMIENLRLDSSAILTTTNTNNPLNTSDTVTIKNSDGNTTNHLSASIDPTTTAWCTNTDATCYNQSMLFSGNTTNPATNMTASDISTSVYSYGNYYNWYSATAGQGRSTAGDICPTGWRLPSGTTTGEYNNLNTLINSGATRTSLGLRKYPANFIYSGLVSGSSVNYRSTHGFYWSSTSIVLNGITSAYIFTFNETTVPPGTMYQNLNYGSMVRCMVSGS